MSSLETRFRRAIAVLLVLVPFANGRAIAGAALTVSGMPSQFIFYNGVPTAFVGFSAEYLPHVTRPGKQQKYCTYDTALTSGGCIDTISRYANKMQIWLALNSSIGKGDGNLVNIKNPGSQVPVPYDYEQPFVWDGQRWHLDQYEASFFSRLNQVIQRIVQDGMVGEVTLFNWEGDGKIPSTSPWNAANNILMGPLQNSIQFTNNIFMVSFDNTTNDLQPANIQARTQQQNFIIHAVQQLNGNRNFYWQIANEPDESPAGGSPTLNITAMLKWHSWVAKIIHDTEAGLPNQHLVAANFWSQTALDSISSHPDPNIQILNGHYVRIMPAAGLPAMYGAITEAQSYHPLSTVNGFNEGRSTPCPSLAGSRAEALEFLVGDGGTYDNYSLDWSSANATTVLSYMNFVRQFVASLNLFELYYSGKAPTWIVSGLPLYGASDGIGLGNTYFAAAETGDQSQYIMYIHHSTIPGIDMNPPVRFNRYSPFCKSAGYQLTLTVNPSRLPTYMKAEWFVPDKLPSGGSLNPVCSQSVYWSGSGSLSIASPKYPYDAVLRLTTCAGGTPCVSNVPCNTVPVAACPPPDPTC